MFSPKVPKPKPLNQVQLQNRYTQGQTNHLTGNRVYNGISNSPHAGGGLDKTGYKERDQKALNKKSFLMKQLKSGGF